MVLIADSSKAAAQFLAGNLDARLIAALDAFTDRNLVDSPPGETESLQRLGVSATNADRRIRKWVNDAFREPNNWKRLERDGLPLSTTFSKLRDLCSKP